MKWYQCDATFTVVPAGDDFRADEFVGPGQGLYEAFLLNDGRTAARRALGGEATAIQGASRACGIEADLLAHLMRTNAILARVPEALEPVAGRAPCGSRSCEGNAPGTNSREPY